MKAILIIVILLGSSTVAIAENQTIQRDPFQQLNAVAASSPVTKQGSLFSLDCNNMPVQQLLQALADSAQINMVFQGIANPALSLHLNKLTLQQALQIVLQNSGLIAEKRQDVWYIFPAVGKSLHAELLTIHYAKAENLAAIIQNPQNHLLSPQGLVIIDLRTNSLWLSDVSKNVAMIKQLVKQFDTPPQQILIRARVVNVDNNFLNELGVKFGSATNGVVSTTDRLTMNLPSATLQTGQLQWALLNLNDGKTLDLELSALEQEGHGQVIASPHLLTENREAAYIEAGDEIPYQEKTSSGATNVTFKKAVLSLKVTPIITSQHHVLLRLTVDQDKVSTRMVQGVPGIETQQLRTQVVVQDGQTVVLGGVFENSRTTQIERVPLLGRLPLIGNLFSSRQIKQQRKQLLVFITPQIV